MWTYGGVRIFAQTNSDSASQTIPRLQPLAGGTVLQLFGYESIIKSMTAIVVGDEDANHLLSLQFSGVPFQLVGPNVDASYYPKQISTEQQMTVYQTLRKDLDCEAPLYTVTFEFYEA